LAQVGPAAGGELARLDVLVDQRRRGDHDIDHLAGAHALADVDHAGPLGRELLAGGLLELRSELEVSRFDRQRGNDPDHRREYYFNSILDPERIERLL